jgi:hypothetical protein
MSETPTPPIDEEEATDQLLDSAEAMGIGIDRDAAEAWIDAMQADASGSVSIDVNSGVYGHRVTMADHDPEALERFRRMAVIVGFEDRPPQVMTALALSGSAAQARIHPSRPTPTSSSASTSAPIPARRRAPSSPTSSARRRSPRCGEGPSAPGGEVRQLAGRAGSVDGESVKRGKPVSWTPARSRPASSATRTPTAPMPAALGGCGADPGWCKLDWVIADPGRSADERLERARPDVGGARRHDHAARRLPRPLLPGGLPRDRLDPAVLQARQGDGRRLGGRLRRAPHRRGLQVHGQGAQLRQGGAPDVQHLPPDRPLRRGRLHPRAVRRAGHRPLPGRGAAAHARRGGRCARQLRARGDGRPGRPADHVGHRRPRGACRGRDGGRFGDSAPPGRPTSCDRPATPKISSWVAGHSRCLVASSPHASRW